ERGGTDGGRNNVVLYSTLQDNRANRGAGIYAYGSFGAIGNSTLSRNDSYTLGGAVDAHGGTIFNSTISGNSASASGGRVSSYYQYAYNTIFANNTAVGNPDIDNAHFVGSFDLVESPGGVLVSGTNHNITGVDPQLGALGNHYGDTPTMKPAVNSPVVDRGD